MHRFRTSVSSGPLTVLEGSSDSAQGVLTFLSIIGLRPLFFPRQSVSSFDPRMPDIAYFTKLIDGSFEIVGASAALVYLAKKFQLDDWLPSSPAAASLVHHWLTVTSGLRPVSLIAAVDCPGLHFVDCTEELVGNIGSVLTKRDWLAGLHPTIADLAVYPAFLEGTSPLGLLNLPLSIQAWLRRMQLLPDCIF